jgi:hypothetical protein
MQTVRLGQFFVVARFLMLWKGREAGSRAKRNENAGLVWRHSSTTTVMKQQLFFASSRNLEDLFLDS